MTRVKIQEAKTHLSRYIDRAVKGDVIIACRHNRPVAELRGVETTPVRRVRVAGLF
jgi:prevent-host-death family protein